MMNHQEDIPYPTTRPTRNLIITGLMGTGKTTVGRLVAEKLNREFIDTDEFIETHYGPAAEILSQSNGDELFKQTEEAVAQQLAARQKLVISTGGRFMINNKNTRIMSTTGDIICLTAELNELVTRLLNSNTQTYRPRFDNAINKLALMENLQRQSAASFSQFRQWDTNGSSVMEVADAITAWYCQRS